MLRPSSGRDSLALLRSRRVPAAFGWALTISQPLHFVAFVILGVQPLDVFAWCLTVVGMGAAAVSLVRPIPAGIAWGDATVRR